ncbi:hypothetical protein [Nonomuraea sp. NPDC046570]|uniref:hypothetical protein n=1 Tax=Nonomuraea sp. NPDC046570 TaxID=3155255 RepID=UPI0033EB8904
MHHTTTTGYSACCGQDGTGQAGSDTLERPRYFPRQLITPDDLTLEADYFRDRMRRHNRYLHGWGVVCGALVCVVPARTGGNEPWLVRVEPGYVLGPYGDEIVVDQACEVPLRGEVGTDPWCAEVYVKDRTGPLYVAIRYREHRARPIHAQPAGCDCDQLACEYSRFRDGYEFGILDSCPASHQPPGGEPQSGNPACPAPPDSPWVVLAEVTADEDGTITKIDNCSCRRIVSSSRDTPGRCGGTDRDYPPPSTEAEAVPEEIEPAPPRRRKAIRSGAAAADKGS